MHPKRVVNASIGEVMIIAQFILAKAIIPAQKIQSQSASVRLS
jgi:hypothetical protein